MCEIPPPPVLASAQTVEQALADLAGAVQIAVELMIEDHSAQVLMSTPWSFMLMVALRQFQDSGFAQQKAQQVADKVAQAYLSIYE